MDKEKLSNGKLRNFRMDAEDKTPKGQSTILRFIRRSNPIKADNNKDSSDKEEVSLQEHINEVLDGIKTNMESKPKITCSNGSSSTLNDSINGNTSINSSIDDIIIPKKNRKRVRILDSDDEEDEEEENTNKKSTSNNDLAARLQDPEVLDKYVDTLHSIYSFVDRMELMDLLIANNYDFEEVTNKLDVIAKEKKEENLMTKKSLRMKLMEDQKEARKAQKEQEKQYRLECRERERQNKMEINEIIRNERSQAKKEKRTKNKLNIDDLDDNENDDMYDVSAQDVYNSDSEEEGEEDNSSSTPARQLVLKFFNEATSNELTSMSNCSKKKSDVIISLRVFNDWMELVKKFKNNKMISTDLLNNAIHVINKRTMVQKLMKKCEKLSEVIKDTATDIIEGRSDATIASQPENMNTDLKLKHYQLIGLNWLVLMHQNNLNGILADEMGLGKTVQAISFLAYLKENEDNRKLHLIVVPSSTIDNWAREIEFWCPDLSVLMYRGSQEERRGMRNALVKEQLDEDIEIILTTYNLVTSSTDDRVFFKKGSFHTVIFDEAHMLKNMASQRYENLMKIKATRRVLLTGTPLQNNLVELMSILVFVMPDLFAGKKDHLKDVFSMFPRTESEESRGQFEQQKIEQAKRILKPFFLRRLKKDVLKDLPPKSEEVYHVDMAKDQKVLYSDLVERLSKKAEEVKKSIDELKIKELTELEELEATSGLASPEKKKQPEQTSSSHMVMTMRKLANHPVLIRNHYDDNKIKEISKILKKTTHTDSLLEYLIEDFSVMSDFEIHQTCLMYKPISKYCLEDSIILDSGKFMKLDILLKDLKEKGSRVLIFSQFVLVLNVIEAYMKIRKHRFLRLDGQTNVLERQELIDEFNKDEEIFIFLLSTRAGGLGINLTSADTVILHDIDFNPYNDKQAEDRCHRVGQTRPVKIIKMISKGTIEQGMLHIANDKLKLEKDVTSDAETTKKSDVVNLLKVSLGIK